MQEKYTPVDIDRGTALLEQVACRHCGGLFTPSRSAQLFCGQPCYKRWWAVTMHPKTKRQKPDAAPIPDKPPSVSPDDMSDDELWKMRTEYWDCQSQVGTTRTKQRERRKVSTKPLVLTGHGVQLRIEHGALLVRNGFTHYPQKREEWRIFPGDRHMPSRIVLIDTDGSVSVGVMRWLTEQHVPLVMLDWQGGLVTACGANSTMDGIPLRDAQTAALSNGAGLEVAKELIRAKIRGSISTLWVIPDSPKRDHALCRLLGCVEELDKGLLNVRDILLIEARAAAAYFGCWQGIALKWKGIVRRPVPAAWATVGIRGQMVGATNRHADHPVNAMLNYAYRVLESQVQIAALTAGLDPAISYLHSVKQGRMSLVYDLMEPLRPEADRLILEFVRSHTFASGDFTISTNGVCRLHPQLAKIVVSMPVPNETVQQVVNSVAEMLRPESRCISNSPEDHCPTG